MSVHTREPVTARSASAWLLFCAMGSVVALLPVLLSLPFLSEPLGRDPAVYFTVVHSGTLPYAEVFDHKPPLIYVWYALSMFMSGGEPSRQIVNLLAALQLSATALAAGWIGLLLGGRRLALVAGLLMALVVSNRYLQFDANTEVFMLPPLVLSVALSIVGLRRRQMRWFCLAGAFCGLAMMTKTVAIFNLVAMVAALAWGAATGQVPWSNARRWSAALVGCSALIVVLTAVPFIASGTFGEFWHANVTYNIAYNAQVPIFAKLFRFSEIDGRVIVGALPVWTLAIIGAVLACRSIPTLPVALLLASAVGAFAGAVSTGWQYPHYFVTLTPFAALFAAMALVAMRNDWHSRSRRLHVELFLIALALPTLLALLPLYALDADQVYEITHDRVEADRAIADEEIASYIASATEPGDRIYNVGRETQLYVFSDRYPAGYYIRSRAFDVQPETFEKTMRSLEAEPPALIVDTSIMDFSEFDQPGLVGSRDELTTEQRMRLNGFLAERYDFQRRIKHATVYTLKKPHP